MDSTRPCNTLPRQLTPRRHPSAGRVEYAMIFPRYIQLRYNIPSRLNNDIKKPAKIFQYNPFPHLALEIFLLFFLCPGSI
jgi:hypothetical protein